MAGMAKLDTTKTTWDLSALLQGSDDPDLKTYRRQITAATDTFTSKWRDRTDYLTKTAVLKEALDELEAWENLPGLGNENFYFGLRLTLDAGNAQLQAADSQSVEFLQGIINKLQFFWLSIGNIDRKLQPKFLAAPELAEYRHFLETKFAEAAHRLSEPEEKILTLKQTVAHDKWQEMTDRFLSQGEQPVKNASGKTVKAGLEMLLTQMIARDKAVRDRAVKPFNTLLSTYLDMAEAEMNALLANKKIDDELRGYARPDSARHEADDISTEVVDTLVEAVTGRFDISRRFYRLKAQLLGQKTLAYHERNVPFGSVEKHYSWPEAVELVREVYAQVNPEFAAIFKRFVEAGQVDVFPKKGKRGGAFCTIRGRQHPVYVMLNHTDNLHDVTTIAHEFGHAVNHELAKKQNSLNYGVSLAVAEVASTFMEGFVLERLLQDADDELRLSLMVDQLDGAVSSIIRQIAMYRFEQELHAAFRKAGFLSHAEIGKLYRKHMREYMGPAVTHEPGTENWWVYVTHFRVMFYVYSYAGGELISAALRARVKQEPDFIKEIQDKFLSVGAAKSAQEMFGDMGIDIADKAFWQRGLAEIDRLLTGTEKLAKKLGKI